MRKACLNVHSNDQSADSHPSDLVLRWKSRVREEIQGETIEKDSVHERKDMSEKKEIRVMRSRKRPSSRITCFSKQSHDSYVQTIDRDMCNVRHACGIVKLERSQNLWIDLKASYIISVESMIIDYWSNFNKIFKIIRIDNSTYVKDQISLYKDPYLFLKIILWARTHTHTRTHTRAHTHTHTHTKHTHTG